MPRSVPATRQRALVSRSAPVRRFRQVAASARARPVRTGAAAATRPPTATRPRNVRRSRVTGSPSSGDPGAPFGRPADGCVLVLLPEAGALGGLIGRRVAERRLATVGGEGVVDGAVHDVDVG